MRLFDIADQIEQTLLAHTDRDTGEISDEGLAALGKLELERDQMCLEVAAYLVGEETEAEAVKGQANRLAARAAMHQRRADRLRKWLAEQLDVGQKLSDDRVRISWRKSDAVEVFDEEAIPDDLWRVKREPDKGAIKAKLRLGENVPGAHLRKRDNVQVRV